MYSDVYPVARNAQILCEMIVGVTGIRMTCLPAHQDTTEWSTCCPIALGNGRSMSLSADYPTVRTAEQDHRLYFRVLHSWLSRILPPISCRPPALNVSILFLIGLVEA